MPQIPGQSGEPPVLHILSRIPVLSFSGTGGGKIGEDLRVTSDKSVRQAGLVALSWVSHL